jgi:hypothetical protein
MRNQGRRSSAIASSLAPGYHGPRFQRSGEWSRQGGHLLTGNGNMNKRYNFIAGTLV